MKFKIQKIRLKKRNENVDDKELRSKTFKKCGVQKKRFLATGKKSYKNKNENKNKKVEGVLQPMDFYFCFYFEFYFEF